MKPIPQLGDALALVQLLQEHPELPSAQWLIDPANPKLDGHLHEAGMEELRQWAEALGGAVRPGADYDSQVHGCRVRPHRLATVWRDVPVLVTVDVPAPVAVTA